jgi:hypothetical protein
MGEFRRGTSILSSILVQLSQLSQESWLNKQFVQTIYDRFLRGLNLLDEGKRTVELEDWEVCLKLISLLISDRVYIVQRNSLWPWID